jgi:hypothetical protein
MLVVNAQIPRWERAGALDGVGGCFGAASSFSGQKLACPIALGFASLKHTWQKICCPVVDFRAC